MREIERASRTFFLRNFKILDRELPKRPEKQEFLMRVRFLVNHFTGD
jgi:hypothetical protein